MSDVQKPTVGRIVQYRQRFGMQAWMPAVVTVDESTYEPGFFADPNTDEGRDRLRLNNPSSREHAFSATDADGEVYAPSPLPALKDGRAHLLVLSPTGQNYPEFNVAEGVEPGDWRWPPRA